MFKQKKSCSNCIKGTCIAVNNDILCREKGAVSPDYICSRHRSAPANTSNKDLSCKCIDCDNFIINESAQNSNIGLCQLFSVRQFDGTQKKACSKFTKRSQLEVSWAKNIFMPEEYIVYIKLTRQPINAVMFFHLLAEIVLYKSQ